MKWLLTFLVVAAFFYAQAADCTTQYKTTSYTSKGVSLSLDDPIGSVYKEGEEVGFSIRTDTDAYVIVFNIDTDGFVHLLYPVDAKSLQRFSSDRAYLLPENPDQSLVVGGTTGIEFVFALAVENRDFVNEDEIQFLAGNETIPEERRFRITGDPLLAANRIASQIVRGISHRQGVTISFTYFYVDKAVDFPRYLCEECYEKGKDPYAQGMPTYAAASDFERTDRLTYPLEEGFALEVAEDSQPSSAGDPASVTKVYVTYYPRWNDGFYDTSWWYLDPWYWGSGYDPYPGSFYFSIGWNWGWPGWGAYHYTYFPYYYCGPYYAYHPWRGYYTCYPHHWHSGGYDSAWRSFRPIPKQGRLYTAMNHPVDRDFRYKQQPLKSGETSDRLRFLSTRKSDLERNSRSLNYRRTSGKDTQVIRGRPERTYKDAREGGARESREVRSKSTSYREQRVITRPSKSSRSFTGTGRRTTDTKGIERRSGEIQRRPTEPRRSQADVAPRSTRSRTESRGTYTPNVRRDSGGKSVSPPRSGQSSGGRSSTKATPPPSRSSPRTKR
jgi:hypothetical protein